MKIETPAAEAVGVFFCHRDSGCFGAGGAATTSAHPWHMPKPQRQI